MQKETTEELKNEKRNSNNNINSILDKDSVIVNSVVAHSQKTKHTKHTKHTTINRAGLFNMSTTLSTAATNDERSQKEESMMDVPAT